MKLGLGTAQFGTDYGISNKNGKVPTHEVADILAYAASAGIEVLDTAATYGASESVLGSFLDSSSAFRVITKIPALDPTLSTDQRISAIRESLCASLKRLRMKTVYGVLLHRALDVTESNENQMVLALKELKHEGLTQKIGVSVYNTDELAKVLEIFLPDLVQLPTNVIDQRFLRSGWLTRLSSLGVETHLRSVFLQGLLLMPASQRNSKFDLYRKELDRFDRFCVEHNLTPLEAALGYVRHLPGDAAIVGVTKRFELEEVVRSLEADHVPPLETYTALACDDAGLVNPSMWRLH